MSALSAEERQRLVEQVLAAVDPRLAPGLREALACAGSRAGKTRLLPLVGELLGRRGLDLDAHVERTHGRQLRTWVAEAPAEFRAAERRALLELPPGGLVSLGGGFLAHHSAVLTGVFTLLVPISFDSYRERLLRDRTRPRLRPELSLEEELSSVFHEREALHARVPTVALVDFLRGCLTAEVLP